MIKLTPYSNKTVAVLGLGKSGLSTVRALLEVNAMVWAWDDQEKARNGLEGLVEPVDLAQADWSKIDLLVMSPGIPHTFPKPHPVSDLAREHNVEIVCDVELLVTSAPEAKYIAITGTNGKSTTTALIHHILKSCGFDAQIGGNFGIAVMELETPTHDSIIILEMSSYQLERTPSLVADIALLMNISPDHLDRHGDMKGYVAAKENIFNNQTKDHFAFIGVDDEESQAIYARHEKDAASTIPVSSTPTSKDGVYVEDGILFDGQTQSEALLDLRSIKTLKGQHNWQNAAAAYGAAIAAGAAQKDVLDAIQTFPGLVHRQEWIATLGNVSFINDSKATNADATQKALNAYEHIYWICGGVAKEGGVSSLKDDLGQIEKAYLIGECANDFEAFLKPIMPTSLCGTLDKAVQQAFEDAKAASEESVVLLSPACASFDQYPNFEARGDAFRKLVQAIVKEAA